MKYSGPQCRILAHRSAKAVPAAHHGRGVWIRIDQCRSAVARSQFAVELDQAHAGGAQDQSSLRPRLAPLPAAGQPQDSQAYLREFSKDTVLCVANLSRSAQPVELNLAPFKGRVPVEMLGRTAFPPIGRSALPADHFRVRILFVPRQPNSSFHPGMSRSFRWMSGRCWCCSTAGPPVRERVVPWRIGMAEKTRTQFETDTLPRYIETQRWYAAKGTPIERARMTEQVLWQEGKVSWLRGAGRTRWDGTAGELLFAIGVGLGRARR